MLKHLIAGVVLVIVAFAIGFIANGAMDRGDDDYYGYDDYYYEGSVATMESVAMDYYYEEPQMALNKSVGYDEVETLSAEGAMIIKSGSIDIHVDDTMSAASQVTSIATANGGYVQSSYTGENYDGSAYASVTFRVPAEAFESSLESIRELSDYVVYESVNADDVTEDYMDLDVRLQTYYELEAQYLEVLDTAVTVEEILMVHDYLQQVRANIESLEASMEYYEDRSSLSTINVYITEDAPALDAASKWRPVSVVKNAFGSWVGFLQGSVNAVIWVAIYLWPLLVIIGGIGYWRAHRK